MVISRIILFCRAQICHFNTHWQEKMKIKTKVKERETTQNNIHIQTNTHTRITRKRKGECRKTAKNKQEKRMKKTEESHNSLYVTNK